MLHANRVTELSHRFGTAPKVAKLPSAVQGGGVPNDVIVVVSFVLMCADDKGVIAFEKACGKLIAQLVCFLRCDLARLEGLANLIGDNITVL